MKRKAIMYLLMSLLLAISILAPEGLAQDDKYPIAVSISFEDGSPLPELEDKLIRAINDLGYIVKSDALIRLDGLLSASGERQISGIGTKSMLNLNLDVQFRDPEFGDVFCSFSATARALGNTREEAIQKGIQEMKIDMADLSTALDDCKDDYLRIMERRRNLSKQYLENGKQYFGKEEYRKAINELKRVYPETEFFSEAQDLIWKIRDQIPEPVIGILKFKTNASGVADNFRNILTTMLIQQLDDEAIILEREQMDKLLGEQGLELQGLVDSTTDSGDYGSLRGAGFLIIGSLMVSGSSAEVDARIVRVKGGQNIAAFHTNAPASELEMIAQGIVDMIYQSIEAGKFDPPKEPLFNVPDEIKNLRVMIMIPEMHIHRAIPDPAGETEMIRKFVRNGFRVVDQAQVKKIRDTQEAKAAAKGDVQAAVAIARQHNAEIIIVGEAFSENVPRRVTEMQTCGARVEARAIITDTGKILAANGKEAHASDLMEAMAAKKALRRAGSMMGDDMINQIIGSWKRGGEDHEMEVSVRKIEYRQLVLLEKFLKDQEGINEVRRRSFDEGFAVIEVNSKANAQALADALILAEFGDFTINIDTVSLNAIEMSVKSK